ncbi:MAG: glycosyltransferase, partial [Phaeodactylibacter sp.]|nr:glycosyltransferase [Phaeodactylibacter sp.]
MKISIITACYNSARTIRDTIDCVIAQSYPDIEYIIIDGHSTDETLAIIQSYGDQVNHLVSEPDAGIYDAMNKGLQVATGDVIGILNSDDFYADNGVVERVMAIFEDPTIDSVFADLQ